MRAQGFYHFLSRAGFSSSTEVLIIWLPTPQPQALSPEPPTHGLLKPRLGATGDH